MSVRRYRIVERGDGKFLMQRKGRIFWLYRARYGSWVMFKNRAFPFRSEEEAKECIIKREQKIEAEQRKNTILKTKEIAVPA